MSILTPLTYADALAMADEAMRVGPLILMRDRFAKALLAVDKASREQSGRTEMLAALNAAADALANELDLKASDIVERAITAADPGSEPIAAVEARLQAPCTDDYADDPTRRWKAGA